MSPKMDQALVQDFSEGPGGSGCLASPPPPALMRGRQSPTGRFLPVPTAPWLAVCPVPDPGSGGGASGQAGKAWPRGCQNFQEGTETQVWQVKTHGW